MIGNRYNGLIVLRYESALSRRRVVCVCDCGKECIREARQVRAGRVKSCGCLRFGNRVPEGSTFGALTVVGASSRGERYCIVECRCGVTREVEMRHLRSGDMLSCGCRFTLKHDLATHGESGGRSRKETLEYRSWRAMIARCELVTNKAYHHYGGRGISVCERWHDYSLFLSDMGRKPTRKHQIERIDNNSGYCPDNCRWATPKEQSCNKRNTVRLTIGGDTKRVVEWARLAGISTYSIYNRIRKGLGGVEALLGKGVTLEDQLAASIQVAKGRKVA